MAPYGGPIFNVFENKSIEIAGIPKEGRCKEDPFYVENPLMFNVAMVKITFIYMPISNSLPWIKNILSIGCSRNNKTVHLENDEDTFVFKIK